MKHFILFILLICGVSAFGQVRPDNFTRDSVPEGTDAFYTQEGGSPRKILLMDFGMKDSGQIAYTPTATGNTRGFGSFFTDSNTGDLCAVFWDSTGVNFTDSISISAGDTDTRLSLRRVYGTPDTIVFNVNNILTASVIDSIFVPLTSSGGGLSDGDKGDITVASSGTVWTIDNDAVDGAAIATDAVGIDEIAANSVGSSELLSTAVTPGSYTNADVTVDQDGRITSASNGTDNGFSVILDEGSTPRTVRDTLLFKAGVNIDFSVIDGTTRSDVYANLISGSVGPAALESTAVTAGSYTNADITVDADGRITAASDGTDPASIRELDYLFGGYVLSSDHDTLANAITAVNDSITATSSGFYLIIDSDVSVIGLTATTYTFDFPVFIQKGKKIISPTIDRDIVGGTSPITGTVADNYPQFQFNDKFIAENNSQVFQGDGLVWFGNQAVSEVNAKWWGLNTDAGTTDSIQTQNVKAIQQAVNSVIFDTGDRATSKVKLPPGDIYLNSPVVAFNTGLENNPYLTGSRISSTGGTTIINIEGAEPVKHEANYDNTTNIFYTAYWGAPLMLQGLRNSSVKNIRWEGENDFTTDVSWIPAGFTSDYEAYTLLVLRPDSFLNYSAASSAWIHDSIHYGRYKPYAAIITDPFRVDTSGGFSLNNEDSTTIDLYYGTTQINHNNSWDVKIESHHCRKFISFLVNTLTGQQGDTYIYRDIQITTQPFGISTCQDQSRDCKAYEIMAYENVHTLFDQQVFGDRDGVMPEIMSGHSAGGLKFLCNESINDAGIININNFYAELIYGVGDSYDDDLFNGEGIAQFTGNGSDKNYPASINNCTFKKGITDYTTTAGAGRLPRPPVISGFNINNSMIGVSGDEELLRFDLFHICDVQGLTIGNNVYSWAPYDYGWFKAYTYPSLDRGYTTAPTFNQTIPYLFNNPINFGYTTGDFGYVFNNSTTPPLTKPQGFKVEETMDWRQFQNETLTLYYELGKAVISSPSAGLLASVTAGNLIQIYENPIYAACAIESIAGDSIVLVNLSQDELDDLADNVDVNDNLTVDIYLINQLPSFDPFVALEGGASDQITIVRYSTLPGTTGTVAKPTKGNKLILADGEIYHIESISGTTITLDRAFTGNMDSVWVAPLYPSFKTFAFSAQNANTGRFLQNGFYYAGEEYEYWSDNNTRTTDKLFCVKTGDFWNSTTAITRYNAQFIRKDSAGNYISFVDGVASSASVVVQYNYNTTGTTANRPDNLGIPLAHIPVGWVYDNTTTGQHEVFDGSAFVAVITEDDYGLVSDFTPTTTLTWDLENRVGGSAHIDCTSVSSGVTLTVNNPNSSYASYYTLYFYNVSGTDAITFPTGWIGEDGTALGTVNLTADKYYACEYINIDASNLYLCK